MATFTKPTSIPRWADDGLNTVEPSEAKKDLGWVFGEEPPSSFENWKENLNGLWWQWINERWGDGATDDDIAILDPSGTNADPIVEFNGTTALTSRFIFTDGATESELQFDKANQGMAWLTGADQEFEVVPLRVTAGRSSADGISLFGVGNLKTIGFDEFNFNAYRFDLAALEHSILVNNFTIMKMSTTDISMLGVPVRIGTGAPVHDVGDLSVENGLQVGGAANPGAGHGIFTDAINVGDDSTPTLGVSRFLGAGGVNIGVVGFSEPGSLHAAKGIKAGIGGAFPGIGDGIFGGGMIVGFDGAPADDSVAVGDANFAMRFDGADGFIDFDGSGKHLRYDRGANRFAFAIGALDKIYITPNEMTPASAGVYDLGSAAGYWNNVNAERFVPRGSFVTDPVVSRFERTHVNGVTCSGKFSATGVLSGQSWNVASISHPSTGNYAVTPTEALSVGGEAFALAVSQRAAPPENIVNAFFSTISDDIEIHMAVITNSAGNDHTIDIDGVIGFHAFN